MNLFVKIIILLIPIIITSCSKKVQVNYINNNYMSGININPSNIYENRRELRTTFSESDFNSKPYNYELSCSGILVKYFYCSICFDSKENSLKSYDGQIFNLINNKSAANITNECIELMSNMSMGSVEYSILLKSQK